MMFSLSDVSKASIHLLHNISDSHFIEVLSVSELLDKYIMPFSPILNKCLSPIKQLVRRVMRGNHNIEASMLKVC